MASSKVWSEVPWSILKQIASAEGASVENFGDFRNMKFAKLHQKVVRNYQIRQARAHVGDRVPKNVF